jgi:hypothetical protein
MRGLLEASGHVPFADVAGLVSPLAQQLRKGDLVGAQMHRVVASDPGEDAGARRGSAGHETGTGGGADRGGGVAVGEADAFGREAIEAGRLDDGMSVAGKVGVAEVVAHENQQVRALGGETRTGGGDCEASDARRRPQSENIDQWHGELALQAEC